MSSKNTKKVVRDIMNENVISVSPTDTLDKVLELLIHKNVHRFPVVNESGKLIGIITDRDIRTAVDSIFTHETPQVRMDKLKKHKVSDCMKTSVVTCYDDDEIVGGNCIIFFWVD